MSRFPTAGHLLAWAGMCPGQNRERRQTEIHSRLRKGAPWLKTILVQCAWAATRKKDSYYGAQFKRLRAKAWDRKKDISAVAASMLTEIYHILMDGKNQKYLGADHFDRRSNEVKARHHVAHLARLGFHGQNYSPWLASSPETLSQSADPQTRPKRPTSRLRSR